MKKLLFCFLLTQVIAPITSAEEKNPMHGMWVMKWDEQCDGSIETKQIHLELGENLCDWSYGWECIMKGSAENFEITWPSTFPDWVLHASIVGDQIKGEEFENGVKVGCVFGARE